MYFYFVLIFSFFIRLIHLNQSLWLDEAVVARVVRTIPFHLIIPQFSVGDFHPPLYYLLMSVWTSIVGYSEVMLRLPSVAASLLTGWVVYRIGLYLGDKRKALWAAVFFLFNPLIMYYSQEARMYMIATLFTTCALYYFLHIVKEKKQNIQHILFFNIFSFLSIFTFYGTLFFIGAMSFIGFITLPKRRDLKGRGLGHLFVFLFAGIFVALLGLFPLLLQQLNVAKTGLVDVKNWGMVLGKADIKNTAMIFLKFAIGRLSWFPKWSYYLVAGSATIVTWTFVVIGMKKNRLFTYLFILPLIFGFFISFWAPMMQYFRFLYLIPVMSLLMGGQIGGKIKNTTIGFIIVSLYCVFLFAYLLVPQFHREDWKSLAKNLNPKEPVYMILPSSDPLSYYNPAVSLLELRKIPTALNVPETMHVIPYVEEIYGINHTEILNKRGCLKVQSTTFRGPLILEVWKCLRNS